LFTAGHQQCLASKCYSKEHVNESKNGSRQYQIGQTARILGQSKTGSLKEIARPDLEWLAAESEETAYLCKQAGDRVYYLDQINSQYHIQLQSWIGKSFAIHTTAPGKIFVAWLPDAELDRYLSQPLQTLTEKTVTDPNQIRAYAKEIRARGFAWTHEQTEAGLIGIAAPIVKGDSELIGAVSLAGPAFRFPKPKQEQSLEKLIVEVGRRISANL